VQAVLSTVTHVVPLLLLLLRATILFHCWELKWVRTPLKEQLKQRCWLIRAEWWLSRGRGVERRSACGPRAALLLDPSLVPCEAGLVALDLCLEGYLCECARVCGTGRQFQKSNNCQRKVVCRRSDSYALLTTRVARNSVSSRRC